MTHVEERRGFLESQVTELGFTGFGFVDPKQLHVSSEVRTLCESNSCGQYGKNWTCPPAVGKLPALEAETHGYGDACVVQYVDTIEDSFDFEGMERIAEEFDKRVRALRASARTWFKEHGAGNVLMLGAGACRYCETCSYQRGEPCVAPQEKLASAEAYGFELKPIVEQAGLSYINGADSVSYVGLLFFEESMGSNAGDAGVLQSE